MYIYFFQVELDCQLLSAKTFWLWVFLKTHHQQLSGQWESHLNVVHSQEVSSSLSFTVWANA